MNEIVEDAKKYISLEKDKNELKKILEDENNDEELIVVAEIELNNLQLQFEKMKKN